MPDIMPATMAVAFSVGATSSRPAMPSDPAIPAPRRTAAEEMVGEAVTAAAAAIENGLRLVRTSVQVLVRLGF
jgi:hypothetical protein